MRERGLLRRRRRRRRRAFCEQACTKAPLHTRSSPRPRPLRVPGIAATGESTWPPPSSSRPLEACYRSPRFWRGRVGERRDRYQVKTTLFTSFSRLCFTDVIMRKEISSCKYTGYSTLACLVQWSRRPQQSTAHAQPENAGGRGRHHAYSQDALTTADAASAHACFPVVAVSPSLPPLWRFVRPSPRPLSLAFLPSGFLFRGLQLRPRTPPRTLSSLVCARGKAFLRRLQAGVGLTYAARTLWKPSLSHSSPCRRSGPPRSSSGLSVVDRLQPRPLPSGAPPRPLCRPRRRCLLIRKRAGPPSEGLLGAGRLRTSVASRMHSHGP